MWVGHCEPCTFGQGYMLGESTDMRTKYVRAETTGMSSEAEIEYE